jgi:hypothetical protein
METRLKGRLPLVKDSTQVIVPEMNLLRCLTDNKNHLIDI